MALLAPQAGGDPSRSRGAYPHGPLTARIVADHELMALLLLGPCRPASSQVSRTALRR